MTNFTYIPNENFTGEDSFKFFGRDKEGALSQLMTVLIDVYNPCSPDICIRECKPYVKNKQTNNQQQQQQKPIVC